MSIEARYFSWTIRAGEDLDDMTAGVGHLFKAIALDDGKLANDGREAAGILLCGGKSGERVTLGYAGVLKFVAGGPIRKGKHLTVTASGYFIEAGPKSYVVGRCLDTTVASGAIGTGAFDFAAVVHMGNSGEIA